MRNATFGVGKKRAIKTPPVPQKGKGADLKQKVDFASSEKEKKRRRGEFHTRNHDREEGGVVSAFLSPRPLRKVPERVPDYNTTRRGRG